MSQNFEVKAELDAGFNLGRAGVLHTAHGDIATPAFIPVGTKATVKAVLPEAMKEVGAQALLANAYHLYLQPGPDLVCAAGGLGAFMNWPGPTFTDSGGFQVLSLGAGYKKVLSQEFAGGVKKTGATDTSASPASPEAPENPANPAFSGAKTGRARLEELEESAQEALSAKLQGNNLGGDAQKNQHRRASGEPQLARVDNDGVNFRSHLDGSEHRFTPEVSMSIQHRLGADIIFAFDELTSLLHSYDYQVQSLERTRLWAQRCLLEHVRLLSGAQGPSVNPGQMLFGVVQGAQWEDLRRRAARDLAAMNMEGKTFDGFGLGGALEKENLGQICAWVCSELPSDKPRHLLGISEPDDFFAAVEAGADTFDCVSPSRVARTGAAYLPTGRTNITRAEFRADFRALNEECRCYTCQNYSRAYLHHLLKAKEMLAATLLTIHNEFFTLSLVSGIREAILAGPNAYREYKAEVLGRYYQASHPAS